MTENRLTVPERRYEFLAKNPTVDEKTRLGVYVNWLADNGLRWDTPDLARYRDYLLYERGLSRITTRNYLASVRRRYRDILIDNQFRDLLYSLVPKDKSIADAASMVNEAVTRLENATNPALSKVTVRKVQDRADSEFRRLTIEQGAALMQAPALTWGTTDRRALRDTALIALMLCTGIRREEACTLDVTDLRQRLNGELALQIREGKGCKQRLVLYGDLEGVCLPHVDAWLQAAAIEGDRVFRSFTRNPNTVRKSMDIHTVNNIYSSYAVEIDGETVSIHPHDTRRSYAKWLYDSGMPLLDIKQQLGHDSVDTTIRYIGLADTTNRRPKNLFSR